MQINELPGPVLIITGPTASGKSACAFEVAKKCSGEIICADSMQIYRGMDIGTAKPSPEEMQQIPHHLFSIVDPDKNFSVADYTEMAKSVIKNVLVRDKVPILCGGTGQYISAMLNGISFPEIPFDPKLRSELEFKARENGLNLLYEQLRSMDPIAATKIHSNDTKRIIRALEVNILSGKTKAELERLSIERGPEFSFLSFCLSRDRSALYTSINSRVEKMIKEGLIDEVKMLRDKFPVLSGSASQAIGYKEFFDYLNSVKDLSESVEATKQATRNYAKRQMTWFRKISSLKWLPDETAENNALTILEKLQEYGQKPVTDKLL